MIATENQLEERIQIIKRLRDYLQRQREKFYSYLELLNCQKTAILAEDTESLQAHVVLERSIVSDISTLQKVIDPLSDLYRRAVPERESSVQQLTVSLNRLKSQVLQHNKKNRELLLDRMSDLRQRIDSIDRPQNIRSPFTKIGEPTLVDISS